MRRAVAGFWWSPTGEGTPALVMTATFFALGGLVGSFFALWPAGDGAEAMAGYLSAFLTAAREGTLREPALMEFVWRALRWPLAAFLLGFTALGVLGIPILTGLRSFCLSFSIAAFAQAYGGDGLVTAFLLLGIPALAYVPAFFLLATQSFSTACALAGRAAGQGRRELPYHREHFFRCGMCAAAVCVGVVLERYIVPALVINWAEMLLK